MAIHRLNAVPTTALVGKFICATSLSAANPFGRPAVIVGATEKEIKYSIIERNWDKQTKSWVGCKVGTLSQEAPAKARKASIRHVCDTLEDVEALYQFAKKTAAAVQEAEKSLWGNFDKKVNENDLPRPENCPLEKQNLCAIVADLRQEFERWNIETNQGYNTAPATTAGMCSYEDPQTEHAWRGFCNKGLYRSQQSSSHSI